MSASGRFDTVVKPSYGRVNFWQCCQESTSPPVCIIRTVVLLAILPEGSDRRRHWGQGYSPASVQKISLRYACYHKKRTRYGVVSMPSGIFPGREFDRNMNLSRNTPPRFLGRQSQFNGFGSAFLESIGHVPVTIGHSGAPHA